jgi:hypothetical protein
MYVTLEFKYVVACSVIHNAVHWITPFLCVIPEEMNMYSAQLNGVAFLRLRDCVSSVCKLDVV